MPTNPHASLTGADLHEPKGVATALANQVYVANGSASGAWSTITTKVPLVLTAVIDDVSTAGTVYIPIPFAGTITQVVTVLGGAITVADSTITVRDAAAASMGTITVAYTGSAAGDVDTLTPASNNTVAANSKISVATDGASTDAAKLYVSVVLTRT